MYLVELSDYEMRLSRAFSAESCKTQQHIEFGQRGTPVRDNAETERDTMIGKMAEIAVAKLLDIQFGLRIPVNFQVYRAGGDEDDLCVNGWHIDVKSTRAGHFLFYEVDKMRKREATGTAPDVVLACRTPWDMVQDIPKGKTVHVIGCISKARLMQSKINKGDLIPGTGCRMQTSNYYAGFESLGEFNGAIRYLIEHRKVTHGRDENRLSVSA